MIIKNLYPASFSSNCYLLIDGKRALVIDPSADADSILQVSSDAGATPEGILLTHGHFDHIVSIDALRDRLQIPVMIHVADADLLTDGRKNAFFTFFRSERRYRPADRLLHDGETIELGNHVLRILHTPGHTNGSICCLLDGQTLFSGDTLFDGGYGRTDLYGGDDAALFSSLAFLQTLPRDLALLPGHGTGTTLGDAFLHLNLQF